MGGAHQRMNVNRSPDIPVRAIPVRAFIGQGCPIYYQGKGVSGVTP